MDVASLSSNISSQIITWLQQIGTNLICPVIAAAAVVYCIMQIPQLLKAHREGMSEMFTEFLWKEIIGLVVALGTGTIWGMFSSVFGGGTPPVA